MIKFNYAFKNKTKVNKIISEKNLSGKISDPHQNTVSACLVKDDSFHLELEGITFKFKL